MGFLKEFKEFATKGNVMDMAVGIIIGGAFGKIINSAVNDLIMPVISGLFSVPDFTNMYTVLKGDVVAGTVLEEARKVDGAVIFAYGSFITVLVNFILLAMVIFMMVKAMNKMRRKKEEAPAAPPAPTATETLLQEIRDELRKKV